MFKNTNKLYDSKYFKLYSTSHSKLNKNERGKCDYINPESNQKCKNHIGLYPQFCFIHTLLINNVFISESNIKKAGNGLFAGKFGFKKGDIIGLYSSENNKLTQNDVIKKCDRIKDDSCWEYVLCNLKKKGQTENDIICWDGQDTHSTIMRFINDARKSPYKNNSYFYIKNNKKREPIAYVIASKNINPYEEIFVSYGKNYWS
jgi:hypothetical protein